MCQKQMILRKEISLAYPFDQMPSDAAAAHWAPANKFPGDGGCEWVELDYLQAYVHNPLADSSN